ncbi:bifunctional hydroxymethylpyrimidine kinase/phosphomethylpyrimidine kinase [Corallococcus sp. ZKHCc1 1396]|uniref:hydroxymethylpyrimidine kinase n=1 Tax=Corallococcus soli TaxID=2710757 RepID=A0ABR9PNH9_9BACT|nr:bifunctional hydroxymethylpyrimidine kinase/phosphomethylpyrimidine kinase [Corallococcus soli]MBE4749478.1 bifunctional hydroxymethylpyrimidine kinase/phosphomethylpyrimidine kinase [Corallococcus soli]
MTPFPVAIALTIAGSDSGGGAGIQADLRTFSFHRVHGTSALTAVTAQNTRGVTRVDLLPPESVTAQVAAVASDMRVDAVKVGMLAHRGIIEAVAEQLAHVPVGPVVVDPVMVSRAGSQLLDDAAVTSLRARMLPLAAILTPNRHEARLLAGMDIETLEDMREAARRIHALGPRAVLVKGGGMQGALRGTDVWFDGTHLETLAVEPVETPNTHGTGCTLSAAIAARLALGSTPLEAVRLAKTYVTAALRYPLAVGHGNGPIGHFFPLNPP